jgi:hypothetical protein
MQMGDRSQWTAQFALSDPVVTTFINFDLNEGVTEANGWPNVEGRLAYSAGPYVATSGGKKRPFGIGVSGLIGQLRRVGLFSNAITDVWVVGTDVRVPINEWLGVKGELFHGQAIGTYNGAALQNFTLVTREGIRSSGGWCDVAVQWTARLHSHLGGGIDDPRNHNLSPGQIERNTFYFANVIWEPKPWFEIGFELSYRETDYVPQTLAPSVVTSDNDAMIFLHRVRIKF